MASYFRDCVRLLLFIFYSKTMHVLWAASVILKPKSFFQLTSPTHKVVLILQFNQK